MKRAAKAVLATVARPLSYLVRLIRATDLETREALRVQGIRTERSLVIAEARLQAELARELHDLQAGVRAETPGNPAGHGFKVYSQADEDGILENILRRLETIAPVSRTFIEVGCGDGKENNTHYLVIRGFRGCWCDGLHTNIASIERALGGTSFPRLRVTQQFLDRNNATKFFEECVAFLHEPAPDLLSVDIDGNDLEIVRVALTVCRPKALCVEYNARFPPPLSLSMAYNPDHVWAYDDYQGASLQAWHDALPDYMLVACSLSGVNAFFVHREYGRAFNEYPLSRLYQPPRHHLISLSGSCHHPSLGWLRQVLRAV